MRASNRIDTIIYKSCDTKLATTICIKENKQNMIDTDPKINIQRFFLKCLPLCQKSQPRVRIIILYCHTPLDIRHPMHGPKPQNFCNSFNFLKFAIKIYIKHGFSNIILKFLAANTKTLKL